MSAAIVFAIAVTENQAIIADSDVKLCCVRKLHQDSGRYAVKYP